MISLNNKLKALPSSLLTPNPPPKKVKSKIWEVEYGVVLQDREFVELDMAYNGAPNKPSETPPPSPDPSLTSLDRRKGTGCCGRRFSPHRRFLVKVSERPKGNPKWLRDEQPCCSNHKWPENHYLWTRCISSAPVINQANQNRHINK